MKGFGPFTEGELKKAKEAWKKVYLEESLTGDIEKDLKIIKEYNEENGLNTGINKEE